MGLEATPNYRAGVVSALTDMFNLPGDLPQRRLIHHNIPVTGGNSGSPMVTADGKLVALLNAGNVLQHQGETGRMPNAAIINYGQRADLVRELVDGTAEASLGAERRYWDKQTQTFLQRGREFFVQRILEQVRPPNYSSNPPPTRETSFTLGPNDSFKASDSTDAKRRQQIHKVRIKGNLPGVFIAYAQESTPIQLYLVVGGQIVAKDERHGIWYPSLRYSFPQDTEVEVFVVSPDRDVSYTFLQYVWDAPGG